MRGMNNFFWHITESKLWAFENKEKITVAIPAPVSGLTQWIRAFVTLGENTFCGFSMGRNQYWAGRVFMICVFIIWRELPKAQPKVVLWRNRESNLRPLVYKA